MQNHGCFTISFEILFLQNKGGKGQTENLSVESTVQQRLNPPMK